MNISKHLRELTELDLLDIADTYYSASEYIRSLGTSSKGQYTSIITNKLIEFDIQWKKKDRNWHTKICPVCKNEFKTSIGTSDERTTCGYSCSNTYFRSGKDNGMYIHGNGTDYRNTALVQLPNICDSCGIDDIDVLQVHHIDEDRNNNEIENLRILCANCHVKLHKNTGYS